MFIPKYNASVWTQFCVLMKRFLLSYWRSLTDNVSRMIVNVIITPLCSLCRIMVVRELLVLIVVVTRGRSARYDE